MNAAGQRGSTAGQARGHVSIPPIFLVLSIVSALFLGGGACGLVAPELVPSLAKPAVAWSFITVGIMLDVAAVFVLLDARKRGAGQDAPGVRKVSPSSRFP